MDTISEQALAHFTAKSAARETALRQTREVIRTSANAIRAVHRREFVQARTMLQHAHGLLRETAAVLAGHQDIYHAGFVHDAAKEFAEASLTLALVAGEPLPDPETLGVEYQAYLNGAGEAVGELRRHLLDLIRHGDIARCEAVLEWMDDIYAVLVTMDFPEAVTGGLRRTTDAVRGILERTRGDLTTALAQARLERKLAEWEQRL
ncbi:MAG: haloacid dehalogenase [Chloroflexi bacterium]|nr:haloacid dehalogenase [Chloroflexota bacterium]